jgi:replicative DNA helicase
MTRETSSDRPGPRAAGRFVSGADLFRTWSEDVRTGTGPILYRHAFPFPEIGPGLVTLIGGAPASGKTTLVNQIGVEMLRFNPQVRILFCNVEMTPGALMDKTLARLSGLAAHDIRHRRIADSHQERVAAAMATIAEIYDRMAFLSAPFDIQNVAASADVFGANVLVLDYIQRFSVPVNDVEARQRLNRTMDYLRQFAAAGVAVLAISAVGRGRDRQGRSSYASDTLTLASYRDSSELEFGADDALILSAPDPAIPDRVRLDHLKARHGMQVSQDFDFDRRVQSFSLCDAPVHEEAPASSGGQPPRRSSLASEIRLLWESCETGADEAPDLEGGQPPEDAPGEPSDGGQA